MNRRRWDWAFANRCPTTNTSGRCITDSWNSIIPFLKCLEYKSIRFELVEVGSDAKGDGVSTFIGSPAAICGSWPA